MRMPTTTPSRYPKFRVGVLEVTSAALTSRERPGLFYLQNQRDGFDTKKDFPHSICEPDNTKPPATHTDLSSAEQARINANPLKTFVQPSIRRSLVHQEQTDPVHLVGSENHLNDNAPQTVRMTADNSVVAKAVDDHGTPLSESQPTTPLASNQNPPTTIIQPSSPPSTSTAPTDSTGLRSLHNSLTSSRPAPPSPVSRHASAALSQRSSTCSRPTSTWALPAPPAILGPDADFTTSANSGALSPTTPTPGQLQQQQQACKIRGFAFPGITLSTPIGLPSLALSPTTPTPGQLQQQQQARRASSVAPRVLVKIRDFAFPVITLSTPHYKYYSNHAWAKLAAAREMAVVNIEATATQRLTALAPPRQVLAQVAKWGGEGLTMEQLPMTMSTGMGFAGCRCR
ncbi:hypothetical protein EDB85DRAFT_2198585 [Lactarius pseudohatsudake]|nr:hypothetical protein EDB85DRAFT_2155777 [Lactarius pseudohatsudake]KAH9019026.1 hypothetical protein EDB85DRAFT_2198585 [Lactarius pseudohatsudake]